MNNMNRTNQKKSILSGLTFEHWKIIAGCMVVYDIIAVNAAYFLALLLRFDFRYSFIPSQYLVPFFRFAPAYTFFSIGTFIIFRLYRSIWRFASYDELIRVIGASIVTAFFHTIVLTALFQRMPLSYYIIGAILQFILVLAVRFSYRFVLLLQSRSRRGENSRSPVPNIMVVGAGNAGQALIRDIRLAQEVKGRVVCIIDDNPNKRGRYIDGIEVVGSRDCIPEAVRDYQVDKIYLAMPSASPVEKREILEICKNTSCELKTIPGQYQFITGEITASKMKKVEIEDLLGRDPVTPDMDGISRFVKGKSVLITGGGGSIGSELARQVAAQNPARLILVDIYENNAYEIQLELKKKYPDLDLEVIIGSVRDSRMMFKVFERFRPQVVYHAAAHKHVPLMEDTPCEAIKNNAIGTYKTAYAAMSHGCERFILISTDKAVNPTNIMGASKRLCEMICQAFDHKVKEGKASEIPQLFTHTKDVVTSVGVLKELKETKTEFVAVRFGNVLGSNGSVIPVFKRQIENGGPVTVTHKDIVRYFMTIPEAVGLVLVAGTYAKGGEIFVLDMGEEVKIDTLARNMIRLSGYRPDVDIKIEYTGLRPGEKLYEEKLMAEEGLRRTPNKRVHIGCPIPFDIEDFLGQLKELMEAAYKNKENIRELVAEVVNTYHPEQGGEAGAQKAEDARDRAMKEAAVAG